MKKYNIILADPPWSFRVWNRDTGSGRSAESHYHTMSIEDIYTLPVANIADKDCVLFLWVTNSLLPEALEVGSRWGFQYKTVAFTWRKLTKHNKEHMGMGYWTRQSPEMMLLFTKGKPKRVSASVRQLQSFTIGRHSEKPKQFHELIVQLMGDLPRAELFARECIEGWDCYGNEIDGRDIRDALND